MSSFRIGILVVLMSLACASGESTVDGGQPSEVPAPEVGDGVGAPGGGGKAKGGKRKAKAGLGAYETLCEDYCARADACGVSVSDCSNTCMEEVKTNPAKIGCGAVEECEAFKICLSSVGGN